MDGIIYALGTTRAPGMAEITDQLDITKSDFIKGYNPKYSGAEVFRPDAEIISKCDIYEIEKYTSGAASRGPCV